MSKADHGGPEHRLEPRIPRLYPVLIRAKTTDNRAITAHTVADNVCSGGVYFQWPYTFAISQRLFMLIRLANGVKIAIRGQILRQEPKPHDLVGVAIRFVQTRVIAWPGPEQDT